MKAEAPEPPVLQTRLVLRRRAVASSTAGALSGFLPCRAPSAAAGYVPGAYRSA